MVRIVREGDSFPPWCQLKSFSTTSLGKAGRRVERLWPNERLVVAAGSVHLVQQGRSQVLGTGQFADLGPDDGAATIAPVYETAQVVWLSGEWAPELGGCGIFAALDTDTPSDKGDAVSYPKSTTIDSHYHDCDEYWIVLEGRATVVVNGEAGEMKPGDCLCIGMGRHHDMPHAPERIKAVYFETSLERQKRVGHLWEHTHGPAVPAKGRD